MGTKTSKQFTQCFRVQRTSQTPYGGLKTTNTTTDSFLFTGNRTSNGVGLFNHRKIILAGDNATTNFSASESKLIQSRKLDTSIVYRNNFGIIPYTETAEDLVGFASAFDKHTPPSHLFTVTTSADNKALIQVRSAVKSQQQAMSGLTFLGELRETVHWMRNPAGALIKGLDRYTSLLEKRKKGIRHGTAAQKRKALVDAAAGSWLEVSFGIQPLLKDVKDIAETIARFQTDDKRHAMVRGYGRDEASSSFSNTFGYQGRMWITEKVTTKTTATVVYRAHLRHAPDLPAIGSWNRLRELAGFNFADFIPTAYQLIPYSFLVDYYSNLGDCIESWTTDTSAVNWVNKSVILETVKTVETTPFFKTPFSNEVFVRQINSGADVGIFSTSLKSVVRTAQSSLDFPSLEFTSPTSAKKWLNQLALIAGRSASLIRF
jgi:hypothetical protein